MAVIASITIKKFDGTTDIIYDAIGGAGGDSQPAIWRQDSGANAALPLGLRNMFMLLTKFNGPRTARQAEGTFLAPYALQDSTTTKWSASDRAQVKIFATMPLAMPATVINEAVYQAAHLFTSAHVKAHVASGYAPT